MNYQTIAEIYNANDKIRDNLKNTLLQIPTEQMAKIYDGEKWSIAMIVEHLAMVENGMMRISAKLLNAAKEKGLTSDGNANITLEFLGKLAGVKDRRVEAPEMVVPSGEKSVSESLEKMDENRKSLNDLKTLFETVGCDGFTFPHPAFGDLNSNEWLALLGGHEMRHTEQIKRIIQKM